MKRKLLAWGLTFAMLTGTLMGCSSGAGNDKKAETAIPTDNPYGLREEVEDGAILHCFSWSFKTIEESLEDIAMAGYSAIQTSPINACYDGGNAGKTFMGKGNGIITINQPIGKLATISWEQEMSLFVYAIRQKRLESK